MNARSTSPPMIAYMSVLCVLALGCLVAAFVVSKLEGEPSEIEGSPLYQADRYDCYVAASSMPDTGESFTFVIKVVPAKGLEQQILARPNDLLKAIQASLRVKGVDGFIIHREE